MKELTVKELLDTGAHFGHLRSKWNPNMAPYIFMEKNGIHIIDLNKTVQKVNEASKAARNIAASGRKILFVSTKKQSKDIVTEAAKEVGMPYVTDRWLGGMLTNFATVRKSIKKMSNIDKMFNDSTVDNMAKRERLALTREKDKLEKVLGGIKDLTRIPAAVYIIDINKEHIANKEALKLNLTSFAMVDTNSNPDLVDYPVPANDDASKSIGLITEFFTHAVKEGLEERKQKKEAVKKEEEEEKERKSSQAQSSEKEGATSGKEE